MPATIVWDIDGTLLPYASDVSESHEAALHRARELSRQHPTYVNTARHDAFCKSMTSLTDLNPSYDFVERDRFYCGSDPSRVAQHKVQNMDAIHRDSGTTKQCTILVDDNEENVVAAREAGYNLSILVQNAREGIVLSTMNQLMDSINEHCAP